ncbi:MAG: PD-(D/E)XK nuclease family protein [Treponema sp.]|nr:PD-(D/E)XK nuclease family protein [Treponema sp.]
MNPVEAALLENIGKPNSLFVFPTDIAASRWADHLLRLRRNGGTGSGGNAAGGNIAGGNTVAMEKFIAWDTFKQNSISSKMQDRKSIPSVMRKMFAAALIRENARLCREDGGKGGSSGGPPVFSSLVRKEWAHQADAFAPWLAEILPQLGMWFRKSTGLSPDSLYAAKTPEGGAADGFSGDDSDLYSLAIRYAQFLEENRLFEPAWETPPFENDGKECFIFFPETLSDFNEYRELLAASRHVKTVSAGAEQQPCDVFFYANSRSEITEAALYILALHNNRGIGWDSISVSVPDGENYGPYLVREFENRNIPYIKRSGKPLASYPAGKFFTSLEDCASGGFSFASLTALLLNKHLPWKDGGDIEDLIGFGIKNNCCCSWSEDEDGKRKEVNVWEDAFNHPFGGYKTETRRFFEDLRRQVNSMRRAGSFAEIRKQYFAFRGRFFDMENALEETDLVFSRCVSELTYLIEIENSFPGVKTPDPYRFFTGYLGEAHYLAQQPGSGVTILPYRTSAPAPFDCHIVLGASQNGLTAVFTPLAFLPANKREKLMFAEHDASLHFINLHRFNSRLPAAFFCSEQTFSGYAIPHSSLPAPPAPRLRYDGDPLHAGKFAADLYRQEKGFYASLHFPPGAEGRPEAMPEMHGNQARGFEAWRQRRKRPAISRDAPGEDHPLLSMIRRKFCDNGIVKNKYSVSPSSLAPYYRCPLVWVFGRVLALENTGIETGLMADNIAGLVYHTVIDLFLDDLKQRGAIAAPLDAGSGKKPVPELDSGLRRLLAEKTETVFESFPRLPKSEKPVMSMLTARLLRAEKHLFYSHLENFLAAFTSYFAGYSIAASETYYQKQHESFFLNGVVDCILLDNREDSPDRGRAVIVDFKTKKMPSLSDCTGEEGGLPKEGGLPRESGLPKEGGLPREGLADFQLPAYLRLAESALETEVCAALFFSIIDSAPRVLFGQIENALSGSRFPKNEEDCIRRGSEKFIGIMNEFDEKAERFAREIASGAFSFLPEGTDRCIGCMYNKVCRTLYRVDRRKSRGI